MKSALLIFILIWGGAAHALPLAPPPSCAAEYSATQSTAGLKAALDQNSFKVDRTFTDYMQILGSKFLEVIKTLTPDRHWLNVGGGNFFAEREYLKNPFFTAKTKVTSVSVKDPDGIAENPEIQDFEKRYGFRHIESYIEDISAEKVGQTDLITDVYSAVTYGHLYKVMAKYAELSKVGGIIQFGTQIFMDKSNYQGNKTFDIKILNIKIEDELGHPVSLEEWIKMFRGIEVVEYVKQDIGFGTPQAQAVHVTLRKTSADWYIPELVEINPPEQVMIKITEKRSGAPDLITYQPNPEPQRSYRIISRQPH